MLHKKNILMHKLWMQSQKILLNKITNCKELKILNRKEDKNHTILINNQTL